MQNVAEQSNNATSPPTLAEALRGYSVHVDTWTVDDGETWAMLYYRELLHANLAALSDAERVQFTQSDREARALDTNAGGRSRPPCHLHSLARSGGLNVRDDGRPAATIPS